MANLFALTKRRQRPTPPELPIEVDQAELEAARLAKAREYAIECCSQAFVRGEMPLDEFERRVALAVRAPSWDAARELWRGTRFELAAAYVG